MIYDDPYVLPSRSVFATNATLDRTGAEFGIIHFRKICATPGAPDLDNRKSVLPDAPYQIAAQGPHQENHHGAPQP